MKKTYFSWSHSGGDIENKAVSTALNRSRFIRFAKSLREVREPIFIRDYSVNEAESAAEIWRSPKVEKN